MATMSRRSFSWTAGGRQQDDQIADMRQQIPWFFRWMFTQSSDNILIAEDIYQMLELQASSPDFFSVLGAGYRQPMFQAMAEQREEELQPTDADASKLVLGSIGGCQIVALPPGDTFHRWFARTLLHVWLALVRLRFSAQTQRANAVGQEVFNRFWQVMEFRMVRDLDGIPGTGFVVGKQLKQYVQFYYGSVTAYDEALRSESDALLAEAVWRNVYQMDSFPNVAAEDLHAVVRYVRFQLDHMNASKLDLLDARTPLRFARIDDMPAVKGRPLVYNPIKMSPKKKKTTTTTSSSSSSSKK